MTLKEESQSVFSKPFRKELLLSLLVLLTIAFFFWTTSRYPQLNEKQAMGERIHLSEALSFDQLVTVDRNAPYWKRVSLTTVNWVNTNKKGMTFGLLFAAAFLALFAFYRKPLRYKQGPVSALMGAIFGAPLGVCVNCAAPIGKSVYSVTKNAQMALATMHSSPTMNFITLTMLFNLFTFQFGVFKVIGTLIFIVFIMPLTLWLIRVENPDFKEEDLRTAFKNEIFNLASDFTPAKSWGHSLKTVLIAYWRGLVYICKKTVPLMLLSGVLGSFVVELVDLESLMTGSSANSYAFVSLLGTFLPVPIAFDVVFSFISLRAGLSSGLTMTLIFTLGVYSIFPFLIIWKTIAPKVAIALAFAVMIYGSVLGYAFEKLERSTRNQTVKLAEQQLESSRLRSLIEEECQSEALKSNTCERDLLFKFAKNEGTGVCHEFQQEPYFKECLAFGKAIFFADHRDKKCGDLKLKEAVKICRGRRARVFYRCRGKSQEAISNCLFQSILEKEYRWGYKNSAYEKACLRLSKKRGFDHPGSYCRSIYEAYNSYSSNNLQFCLDLKTSSAQQNCLRLAVYRLIEDGKQLSSCGQLEDKKHKKSCEQQASVSKAVLDRSYSKCDLMTDSQRHGDCLYRVAYEKIRDHRLLRKSNELSQMAVTGEDTNFRSFRADPTPPIARIALMEESINAGVKILSFSHKDRKAADERFSLVEGPQLGVTIPKEVFKSHFYEEPFSHFEPIATGDFNNDQWPDLLISNNFGMRLFVNVSGERFHEVSLPQTLKDYYVGTMNFVDINNDGWLDIMVSSYFKGSFFLLNNKGSFLKGQLIKAPSTGEIFTFSRTFADVDQNGYLDYLSGNWSMGTYKAAYEFPTSRNHFVYNSWPRMQKEPLSSHYVGETLTSLLSDVNSDGIIDLLIGNDYEVPDQFFFATGRNSKNQPNWVFKSDYPNSAVRFTMSIDSADFNNDLLLDVYTVTFNPANRVRPGADYCEPIKDKVAKRNCYKSLKALFAISERDAETCKEYKEEIYQNRCLVGVLNRIAVEEHDSSICAKIPDSYWATKKLCNFHTSQDLNKRFIDRANQLPRQVDYNLFWKQNSDGSFSDKSFEFGVDDSYWAWTAKFADLDNDEWQDIYSANGSFIILNKKSSKSTNRFFHNQEGKGFTDKTAEFGLTDYMHTYGFSYVDFDNDGDLDIISTSLYGPLKIYRNNESSHNSISIRFQDHKGNRFGIGNKVYIKYGPNSSKKQMRELKLGGGFISFDPATLHFGLGNHKQVDEIVVVWSTGGRTKHLGPFLAGKTYMFERR